MLCPAAFAQALQATAFHGYSPLWRRRLIAAQGDILNAL
jgi:hypothetical protein